MINYNYQDSSLTDVANAIDTILMSDFSDVESRVKNLEDVFFVLKDFILSQQIASHFA